MKHSVLDMQGGVVEEIDLDESIFGIDPNIPVMHQALVRQMANYRQGTQSTLTRSEVNRTGTKLFKQKGTGRGRQGSRRAPHWIGGGVAHAPKPRKYTKDMPRKMRRLAIRSVLSAKVRAGQLRVVSDMTFDRPKTKTAAAVLQALGVSKSAVLLTGGVENDQNVTRSFNNLPQVKILHWQYVNVRDLLGHDHLVIPVSALRRIEALWGAGEGEVA